jgi:hypothetical protein
MKLRQEKKARNLRGSGRGEYVMHLRIDAFRCSLPAADSTGTFAGRRIQSDMGIYTQHSKRSTSIVSTKTSERQAKICMMVGTYIYA